jgi:hypothetical protein
MIVPPYSFVSKNSVHDIQKFIHRQKEKVAFQNRKATFSHSLFVFNQTNSMRCDSVAIARKTKSFFGGCFHAHRVYR